MKGVSVRIASDTASDALRAWLAQQTPARVGARIGPPMQTLTMQWLAALGPNVKGWPSTKFWEKFARNVRWLPHESGVAIAVLPAVVKGRQVGIRQSVFGGTIAPVTVRMLAIPISPVSYGKVPSDFPQLFLLKTPKGAYLVQYGEEISAKTGRLVGRRGLGGHAGRRQRAALNFLFKLQRSVYQPGNRNVLPSDQDYLNTAALWAGKN